MEAIISHLGLLGLFLVSFTAATLVPLSSEGAVAALAASGFDPVLVLVTATAGNSLGALVNYFVGKWGGRFVFSRWIRVPESALNRAERTYGKYGAPVLFLAWLPVVGDPLTVAAGVLKVKLPAFLFWVILGKAFRYGVVLGGMGALGWALG
ncbi:MAG: DedA family protein [Proteobacteria bacterium]|nr:DedA family protein [Pseudomonadota bacterium]